MKLKLLFAVLLGLLMIGVTAGSAAAAPIHNQPAPQGGVGAGSVIDTRFEGNGVISTSTYPIYLPQLQRWLVYQKVRHGSEGYFKLTVYRIPVFGYDTLIAFPDGMKVYTNKASGMKYEGKVGIAYHFRKSGWFVWKIQLKLPVKFTAGRGHHAVISVGGSPEVLIGGPVASLVNGEKPKLFTALKGLLSGQITKSNVISIVAFALASGANVDVLVFNEV
ncbi:hypothetical protein [Thermococcus sp.]|uniref:hypothetical protein n=1 Tax=Thermococcus sp. TaxID=35749 RepID=UPI0026157B24|nr:hypothetical protein [Thermococcus sp.]